MSLKMMSTLFIKFCQALDLDRVLTSERIKMYLSSTYNLIDVSDFNKMENPSLTCR